MLSIRRVKLQKSYFTRFSNGKTIRIFRLFQNWMTLVSCIQMNPVFGRPVFKWLLLSTNTVLTNWLVGPPPLEGMPHSVPVRVQQWASP